jgi:hypothetical protein
VRGIFDFRRLSGSFGALVAVAFAACALSVLGHAVTSIPAIGGVREHSSIGFDGYQLVMRKMAAARRQSNNLAPTAVILGSSTMRVIAPELSESIERRCIDLRAPSVTLYDIERLSRIAIDGDTAPGMFILGLNLGMLSDTAISLDHMIQLPPALRRTDTLGRAGQMFQKVKDLNLVPLNALFPRRSGTYRKLEFAVDNARRVLLNAFGVHVTDIETPDKDPWGSTPEPTLTAAEIEYREKKRPTLMAWQRDLMERRGWFKEEAYSPNGVAARSLARVIANARAHDIKTVIVLVPEPALVRSRTPKAAEECLRTTLANAPGGDRVQVIDLRELVSDDHYGDAYHTDEHGRRLFTKELARRIRVGRVGGDPAN